MLALGELYSPLFLITFVFLCLGLAGQPAVGWAHARSRDVRTRAFVDQLTPVWHRATSARPGISGHVTPDDAEGQLHRQIVEIRDAVLDPRVTFELGADEHALVDAAERHLVGVPAPAASVSGVGRPRAAH